MKNLLFAVLFLFFDYSGTSPELTSWDFDAQLKAYFIAETDKIVEATSEELSHIKDWSVFRDKARNEMQDMLGLLPFPEKTPLKATITGSVEHEEFIVEKLHFQSMPGLYVTANLYIPKTIKKPAPAIIYVCGHATVVENGYNYGAKVHYQHHPAWFARHGYVCLILDTVQLGEIEGIHHGLYRFDRWWWLSRGYTPAGVEAWNGIRAIDYLVSRPEVDADKIGITGRSGGGATSWWVAPLDDRIKVTIPVAGITDLQDHVVEGCVEGHCDCMNMFNTYQWDYPKVAALVAPRPLLISNTDRDPMFPIAGVFRTYQQVRSVYEQINAPHHLALNTTSGPHQDVQELRIHAFRWFNHFLSDHDELIEKPAQKFFTPEQLRVFKELPDDALNARIDEVFVPLARPVQDVLDDTPWEEARKQWYEALRNYVFRSWPTVSNNPALEILQTYKKSLGTLTLYNLKTDGHTRLPVYRIQTKKKSSKKNKPLIIILDDDNWTRWAGKLASTFPGGPFWEDFPVDEDLAITLKEELARTGEIYLVSSRGSGLAKFSGDEKKQIHIRRRYYLLGQTLHAMQTWDILQAIRAIGNEKRSEKYTSMIASATSSTAGLLLYASLFVDTRLTLQLDKLPESHQQGPYYLNIMRYLDMPAGVLMAAEKHDISLTGHDILTKEKPWEHVLQLSRKYPQLSLWVGDKE